MKLRQTVVATFLLLQKGIARAVQGFRGLRELEEEIGSLVRECAAQILQGALESLDEGLSATRPENLEVEGFRSKTLVSTFGELKLRRRLYRDKSSGEWRLLLDEVVGLEQRARVTPKLRNFPGCGNISRQRSQIGHLYVRVRYNSVIDSRRVRLESNNAAEA